MVSLYSRSMFCLIGYLFDRRNWDPKKQIKYIDTKDQFADILTKGSFTQTSKRLVQEEKPGEDERVVAKSKPMRNLASKTVDRSPTALGVRVHLTAQGRSNHTVRIRT